MLNRTLNPAAVLFLVGLSLSPGARAENLEAGKSPSQIFSTTCTACHKGARGLLKSVPAASLPGYLRQHYTTSVSMASTLSAYLISNGAADRTAGNNKPRTTPEGVSDAKPADTPQLDRNGRPVRPGAPVQEAARPDVRPDVDGLASGRPGRNAKRLENASVANPAGGDRQPAHAAVEPGFEGRTPLAKQKLANRGRPALETAAQTDSSHGDVSVSEAKEGASPLPIEGKTAALRPDATSGGGVATQPALRADPVPAVTPAPAASEFVFPPVQPIETGTSAMVAPAPTITASTSAATPAAVSLARRPSVPPPVPASAMLPEPEVSSEPPTPPISQ